MTVQELNLGISGANSSLVELAILTVITLMIIMISWGVVRLWGEEHGEFYTPENWKLWGRLFVGVGLAGVLIGIYIITRTGVGR